MHRVGILLAGCGALDGSDIHEVVLAAAALERALLRVVYVAPDAPQLDVVNHAAGTVEDGAPERGVLVESARLARGRIEPLTALALSDLSALIVPGGLGCAKNLFQDVLVPGRRATLRPDVAAAIEPLRRRSAVLAAIGMGHLVFGALGETFEGDPLTAAPDRAVIDTARRLAWAPGFLGGRTLGDVALGIEQLTTGIAAMLRG